MHTWSLVLLFLFHPLSDPASPPCVSPNLIDSTNNCELGRFRHDSDANDWTTKKQTKETRGRRREQKKETQDGRRSKEKRMASELLHYLLDFSLLLRNTKVKTSSNRPTAASHFAREKNTCKPVCLDLKRVLSPYVCD